MVIATSTRTIQYYLRIWLFRPNRVADEIQNGRVFCFLFHHSAKVTESIETAKSFPAFLLIFPETDLPYHHLADIAILPAYNLNTLHGF